MQEKCQFCGGEKYFSPKIYGLIDRLLKRYKARRNYGGSRYVF